MPIIKKYIGILYDLFASAWIKLEKGIQKCKKFFGRWQIQALMIMIPFILGLIGYIEYYNIMVPDRDLWTLRTPLTSTLKLFTFSFDAKPNRDPLITGTEPFFIILYIARWMAMLLTGSKLIEMLQPVNRKFFSDFKFRVIWRKKGNLLLIGSNDDNRSIYRSAEEKDRNSYPMILCSSEDEFKKLCEDNFNCIKLDKEKTLQTVIKKVAAAEGKKCSIVINTKDESTNLFLSDVVVDTVNEIVSEETEKIQSLNQVLIDLNTRKKKTKLSQKDEKKRSSAQEEMLKLKESVVSKLERIHVVVFGQKQYETAFQKMEHNSYGVLRYTRKSRKVALDMISKYPISSFIDRDRYINQYGCVDKNLKINVIFIGFGNINQDLFVTSTITNQFVEADPEEIPHAKNINYCVYDKTDGNTHKSLNHTIFRYNQEFLNGIRSNTYYKEDYLEIPPDPAKITIRKLDINEPSFYEEIRRFCTPEPGKDALNLISVALGSDLDNIDLAQKLRSKANEWALPKTVIFANVKYREDIRIIQKSDKEYHPDDIIPFGGIEDIVLDLDNIFNGELEEVARQKHYMNALIKTEKGERIPAGTAEEVRIDSLYEWHTYDPDKKMSSLYSILSLRSKLQLMGLDYRKKQENSQALKSNDEYFAIYAKDGGPEIDKNFNKIYGKDIYCYPNILQQEDLRRQSLRQNLAIQEHLRWNAFMISRGFIPASRERIITDKNHGKDYVLRTHGNLTTEEGLIEFRKIVSEVTGKPETSTDIINYDFHLMDDAWWYLDMFGYEIYKRD